MATDGVPRCMQVHAKLRVTAERDGAYLSMEMLSLACSAIRIESISEHSFTKRWGIFLGTVRAQAPCAPALRPRAVLSTCMRPSGRGKGAVIGICPPRHHEDLPPLIPPLILPPPLIVHRACVQVTGLQWLLKGFLERKLLGLISTAMVRERERESAAHAPPSNLAPPTRTWTCTVAPSDGPLSDGPRMALGAPHRIALRWPLESPSDVPSKLPPMFPRIALRWPLQLPPYPNPGEREPAPAPLLLDRDTALPRPRRLDGAMGGVRVAARGARAARGAPTDPPLAPPDDP